MFKEDMKMIKACIEHNDYYSAMEYAMLIKSNYKNNEKTYIENIIKMIKSGEFKDI